MIFSKWGVLYSIILSILVSSVSIDLESIDLSFVSSRLIDLDSSIFSSCMGANSNGLMSKRFSNLAGSDSIVSTFCKHFI